MFDFFMIVIVSGGPGVGKTSVINKLRERGYNALEEAARKVATEDNRFSGKSINEIDRRPFQEAIFELQKKLFDVSPQETWFSDRGFGDTIGYYPVIGYEAPQSMVNYAKEHIPDYVFILDLLPEMEKDNFRQDSLDDQKRLQESFIQVYEGLSCDVIQVPVMSVSKRADYILDRVKFNN